jgi:hypothetical protein
MHTIGNTWGLGKVCGSVVLNSGCVSFDLGRVLDTTILKSSPDSLNDQPTLRSTSNWYLLSSYYGWSSELSTLEKIKNNVHKEHTTMRFWATINSTTVMLSACTTQLLLD